MIDLCIWYVTVGALEYELVKLSIMNAIGVGKRFVVLHNDPIPPPYMGELQRFCDRIYEIHAHFGWGEGVAVENGGWDEIACRNYAIEIAEGMGCEWLLQCDADEYYRNLPAIFAKAKKAHAEGIYFSTWPVLSTSILGEDPKEWSQINGKRIYSPHLRAWKSKTGIKYRQNGNSQLLERLANKSLHCVPTHIPKKVYIDTEPNHIHTHDLWPHKKRDLWPHNHLPLPEPLPQIYLDYIRSKYHAVQ